MIRRLESRQQYDIYIEQISQRSTLQFEHSDITQQLKQKYKHQFEYFFTTPINYIVFNQDNHVNSMFKQIAMSVEPFEYLKRYYYIDTSGKNEAKSRIKMLYNYYTTKGTLGSFYPTMFITQTKDIFMKRFYRITKTFDPNYTSENESELPNKKICQIPSLNYSENINEQNFFTSQISFQNNNQPNSQQQEQNKPPKQQIQIYKIYQPEIEFIEEQSSQIDIDLNYWEIMQEDELQTSVSHLICDFQQFDVKQMLSNYAKYTRKKQQSHTIVDSKKQNLNSFSIKKQKKSEHNILQNLNNAKKQTSKTTSSIHIEDLHLQTIQTMKKIENYNQKYLQNITKSNQLSSLSIPLSHKISFSLQAGNETNDQLISDQYCLNFEQVTPRFRNSVENPLVKLDKKLQKQLVQRDFAHKQKVEDKLNFQQLKQKQKNRQIINRANLLLQARKPKQKYHINQP